jgi:hypothetical protein
MNISGEPLSDDCIRVLSKELSFAPTYSTNELNTKIDLFHFYRNLQVKAWYKQNISPTTDGSVSGLAVSVPSNTF